MGISPCRIPADDDQEMIRRRMKMEPERRSESRRIPKAVTFVALRPDFVKLGKLANINSMGLCFEYLAKGDDVQSPDSLQLDMFISGNGYYLANVPCRLIYDVKASKEMRFMGGLEYRRCGLQFSGLSGRQIDQLEYYLTYHTTDTAPAK